MPLKKTHLTLLPLVMLHLGLFTASSAWADSGPHMLSIRNFQANTDVSVYHSGDAEDQTTALLTFSINGRGLGQPLMDFRNGETFRLVGTSISGLPSSSTATVPDYGPRLQSFARLDDHTWGVEVGEEYDMQGIVLNIWDVTDPASPAKISNDMHGSSFGLVDGDWPKRQVSPLTTISGTVPTAFLSGRTYQMRATDAKGNATIIYVTGRPPSDGPVFTVHLQSTAPIFEAGSRERVVSGTATPGAEIEVTDANAQVLGSATVNDAGEYQINLSRALTPGEVIAITASDVSGASQAHTLTATSASANNGAIQAVPVNSPTGLILGLGLMVGLALKRKRHSNRFI